MGRKYICKGLLSDIINFQHGDVGLHTYLVALDIIFSLELGSLNHNKFFFLVFLIGEKDT